MPSQSSSSSRFARGFGGNLGNAFGGGFGPLLGAGPSDQHLRVSDAERQAVADRLAEHYSSGRLDQAEFDERVGRAMGAKTRADFDGLFDDLPEPGPAGASGMPSGMPSGGAAGMRSGMRSAMPACRRRGNGRKVLAIALLGIIALAAAHAVIWLTVPWLWLGFVAVILLAATGHLGRPRARQDR